MDTQQKRLPIISPHISPSQIHTADRCLRKWGFSRLLPRKETASTRAGTATHNYFRKYFELGEIPPLDVPEARTCYGLIGHYPRPGSQMMWVEQKFKLHTDSIQLLGDVDLIYGYVPQKEITIVDHKTCRTFDYAKTTQDLEADPQWVLYGTWAALTFDVEIVHGIWGYLRRCYKKSDTPKGMQVRITKTRNEMLRLFWEMYPRVKTIWANRGVDPHLLAPNTDACEDFGGCEYQGECAKSMSREQLVDQLFTKIL